MLNYSIPIQLLIKMFKIENITEMREKFWYVAVIVIFYYKRENPEKDLFIREIVLKTECFHSELSTLSGVDINQARTLNISDIRDNMLTEHSSSTKIGNF